MKKIIPAILTKDVAELERILKRLQGLTDWVQIDIMDGKFVRNTSIALEDISRVAAAGDFLLEAHLMVENPAAYFEVAEKVGIKRVVFHIEAGDVENVISEAKKFNFQRGIALDPETLVAQVLPYIKDIDVVMLMSVNPGFGGQAFISGVIDKIKELRKAAPHVKIEVDGGINAENIPVIADAGADYLVVGKGLFGAEDIKKQFNQLQSQL